MSKHIPRHRADVIAAEPSIGPEVHAYLSGLTYEQLYPRYISVYKQFDQESRLGEGADRLQMAEIEKAYPGVYKLIEAMAGKNPEDDFSNGIVMGAVAILSTIKSSIEVNQLEELLLQS